MVDEFSKSHVLLLCLLFPCIVHVHFHFIIVLFFYRNLAVFITCYSNIKLTYLLTGSHVRCKSDSISERVQDTKDSDVATTDH